MKKLLWIFVLLAGLLTAAAPVTVPVSSWYSSPAYSESSLVVYGPEWFNFGTTAFETQSNGFYVLDGDIFTTTYRGAVKLSGACIQSKASPIWVKIDVGGRTILLADTFETSFTFLAVFPANDFTLQAYNRSRGTYDELWCTVLVEKVL